MAIFSGNSHVLSLGMAVLISITTAAAFYREWRQYAAFDALAEQTRAQVDQIEQALSLLKDAETGQRGYLLTGDAQYLSPYEAARAQIPALIGELSSRESSPELSSLQKLIGDKFAELQQTIDLQREADAQAAVAIVRTGRGRSIMDAIRTTADEAIQTEDLRLRSETTRARSYSGRIRFLVLIGFLMITGLLLISTFDIHRLLRAKALLVDDLGQARQIAEQEKKMFETTLQSIGDGVISTDDRGQIRFMNSVAEQLTGWTQPEAAGRPLSDVFRIISEKTHKPSPDPVSRVLREGRPVTLAGDAVLIARNGREIAIAESGAPIRAEGQTIAGVVLAFHDVTEQKRLESQLRQSQRLEAIGRLAGGVAHDFNNLLTVISGYADILGKSDRIDRDAVQEIGNAADRASSLTRQLLAFSRHQILQPQSLNLNTSVTKILPMLHRLLGEDITVDTEIEADLWNTRADPGQIDQIIMNLAVNARDAMETGGTITICTENVHLDDTYAAAHIGVDAGEYVVLSVSDTGTGLTEEAKTRLFEPFFTTKEPGRGTGLGLSTVYGIVKQSAGNIWVYSETGKGTTFKVYLPRFTGEEVEEHRPVQSTQKLGHGNILVIEDDLAVRKLVCLMLGQSGYRAIAAGNADEAIRICSDLSQPLDLLISDLVLPGVDGREIGRRALEARPELKMLFMSGYTEHAVLGQNPFESGKFFIQKPFTQAALARKLREILHGETDQISGATHPELN